MLTLLAFLVVIGVLIFVHELGHLIAAKSVDIKVPRFSIGFGPKVLGFHWGETEYVISALPLGGYVRMAGMEDAAAMEGGDELASEPSDRDFDAKPLWARVWVVSAGVLMNFLFAVLVWSVMFFTFGRTETLTTRIDVREDAAASAPAALQSLPTGAEVVRVGDREVESWENLIGALADAPSGAIQLSFSDAEPVMIELPADEESRGELLGWLQPFIPAVIGEVMPGTPAEEAGLQRGDQITAAAGEPLGSWPELVETVQSHPGEPLTLTVVRDGAPQTIEVVPLSERRLDPEMQRVQMGHLGVAPMLEQNEVRLGPLQSLGQGASMTWGFTTMIVELLGDLVTGDASPRTLGGPLAIGQLSGEAARLGADAFLHFMALLSVNLAVLNLLPIPVLDGGQLMFLGLEAARGRPLSIEQRIRMSNVGLILVVGLMVWAITNDFLRFFGI